MQDEKRYLYLAQASVVFRAIKMRHTENATLIITVFWLLFVNASECKREAKCSY